MTQKTSAGWVYNQTVKMFATPGDPPHEDPAQLEAYWGRAWGLNNDVGRIRSILVHRPGAEMSVVDPTKRIESIGSFGDIEAGWYFQSDEVPLVAQMQAQHDALTAALTARGIEVFHVDGVDNGRLKSCYTRDPLIMVKGGAIVCRMGTRVRRGEELAVTRTLARLGIPILRTLSGSALMEGGSFAWINPKTAVIGCGIRVNREGAAQIGEVLARQGVELITIDLTGYDIHIDGSFLMIDRDPSEGAPDSGQPAQKGALPRHIGRTKGGLNSKLHAVCDSEGRPRSLFLTAGQVSDYTGAAALLATIPPAKVLLADRGYDADWLRNALADRKIEACIPSKSNRKIQIPHDRALYRKRHRIENMFGKLKDWRRIHTRYDRCAHTFMSAIAIAAIVIFWI